MAGPRVSCVSNHRAGSSTPRAALHETAKFSSSKREKRRASTTVILYPRMGIHSNIYILNQVSCVSTYMRFDSLRYRVKKNASKEREGERKRGKTRGEKENKMTPPPLLQPLCGACVCAHTFCSVQTSWRHLQLTKKRRVKK